MDSLWICGNISIQRDKGMGSQWICGNISVQRDKGNGFTVDLCPCGNISLQRDKGMDSLWIYVHMGMFPSRKIRGWILCGSVAVFPSRGIKGDGFTVGLWEYLCLEG